MAFGIDDALAAGLKIIDKFVPDPAEKAKAIAAHEQLVHEMDMAVIQADAQTQQSQAEINKIEAASEDSFTRRWRPFIGWICGIAFLYHFILLPLLLFIFSIFGRTIQTPSFDMNALYTVLMGMLGLGTMRTAEKIIGGKNATR